jgi:hypothetical protein
MEDKSQTLEASKVKVLFEGQTVEADELTFSLVQEGKVICKASDGAVIEIIHDVKSLYRLEKKKQDGSPIYLITGNATIKQVVSPQMAEEEVAK